MLFAYCPRGTALERVIVDGSGPVPDDAIWLDLLAPTLDEDRLVEQAVGLSVPTREEMVEIEPSSRLYVENGARFMTGSLVCNADTDRPTLAAITFILLANRLVTVRYDEPKPFRLVAGKLGRICPAQMTGDQLLFELLDAIIDRAADIIEHLGAAIDGVSQRIFEPDDGDGDVNERHRALLREVGRKADLASKVRESLVSMARLVTFLGADNGVNGLSKDQKAMLKSMHRDAASLNNHVSYLADKITFLLDATLGLVSIEQNNIIKIFAVLSVVLMPPTLIASVYGMNFTHMPELEWRFGYPLAMLGMLAAAVVPYMVFKWKRWL